MDWYVFQGIKTLTPSLQSETLRHLIHWSYWIVSAGLPLLLLFIFVKIGRMNPTFSFMGSLLLTLIVTKLTFLLILAGGDFLRLAEGSYHWLLTDNDRATFLPERRKFVAQMAVGVAMIPFTSFLYGMVKGKYRFKVHRHTLTFKDLPPAFDGFTITQISDVHAGSFDDYGAVQRGVDLVNAQGSDLFVFTGDLVNSVATEFDRWLPVFKQIKAPFGQFSILGNHDYGDYHPWPNATAKAANLEALKKQHDKANFRLLLDEHVLLEKEGQKIALLGVENWGVGFGKRGNLKKAITGIPADAFKILLSHDPSHWDHEVKHFDTPVHLTLSGHTHGMQFGVEIPGWKWSPSKLKYPKWAGVYEENGKYINVNRGFGFLGFSGRVGIWPEITVIELKRPPNETVDS
jgi:hypothetical protein